MTKITATEYQKRQDQLFTALQADRDRINNSSFSQISLMFREHHTKETLEQRYTVINGERNFFLKEAENAYIRACDALNTFEIIED